VGTARRAVVTGAGGGLGEAFCRALAARGYDVVGTDVAGTERRLDVTDPDACRALATEVDPEVWVNNAGILGAGPAADQPDDEIERLVAVNFLGVAHGTRAAVAVMRPRRRGHVVNVGSLASWATPPGETVYAATKHAVRAFSVGLDTELRGTGVRVSLLCPGPMWTPMLYDRVDDPSAVFSFSGRRMLTADEVAAVGVGLLDRPRPVASVPATRGLSTRLIGIVPSLAYRLGPLAERQARRDRTRFLARKEPTP
jgi:short-subunit dehydrogenase